MRPSISRIIAGANRRAQRFVNHKLVHPIDCRISEDDRRLEFPPIFIIGPPRSGSTLLMQVLIDAFEFGYFSNMHCAIFGAPSVAERFFYSREKRKKSSFDSEYGVTDGRFAPSECGEYWYRFFPRKPMYAPMQAVTSKDMRRFRMSLTRFVEACGRPVLFKNLLVALRLEPVIKYVPEALYIVTRRDVVSNAVSLLAARQSIYGSYDPWWSMEPPGIDRLKSLPAAQQVVEQIREIQGLIESDFDRAAVDRKRILTVKYEDFCKDVNSTLQEVESLLQRNNTSASRLFDVPREFSTSNMAAVPGELLDSVKEYAARA